MINKTQFDKIYVISLIFNKDRQEFIKYQMKELDIDFEFIYGIDFYNFKKDAANNDINWCDVYGYVKDNNILSRNFGCTISHYKAILQAYELGYNNVLVIEDDICFIKDEQRIIKYLNNIPQDSDFVTFDTRFKSTEENTEYNNCVKLINNSNNMFIELPNNYDLLVGGMMYGIMNRKTMQLYMNNQHEILHMSDNIIGIFEQPNIKRYISSKCLCTDCYNIKTNFNVHDTAYKCIYKDIEKLTIDNFYIKENIENIFTRQNE